VTSRRELTLRRPLLGAQFVDPGLERFAAANGRGINIVDDRFGFRPAGTEAWIKS
jgi:hypothetical protein